MVNQKKNPSLCFSKENTDITFLDKPVTKEEAKENEEVKETIAELDNLIYTRRRDW